MKKNIALIGFMGTGKTTVGLELANVLGWSFIDTDKLIEEKKGMTIPEIFHKFGETGFRLVEKEVIKEVSGKENQVISTGGGVVLNQANVDNLKWSSMIICLQASPQSIYHRVGHDQSRPLLAGADPIQKITKLLEERKPYYQNADFFIDTSQLSIEEIVKIILAKLESRGKVDVRVNKSQCSFGKKKL